MVVQAGVSETAHEKIQENLLSSREQLTTWEREFLESLMGFLEFSPNQSARLEIIYRKLGVPIDESK